MKFLTWQDWSHARYNPRCINGINGCVLLISMIYRCPSGHLIISSDPSFLGRESLKSAALFLFSSFIKVESHVSYNILFFIIVH